MEENYCLNCNKVLHGRSDKKFCDTACRSEYHNRNQNDSTKIYSKTNQILRKNRMILKSMNPKGKSTVEKVYLLERGYDFRFFTTFYKTKNERVYFFCYEYGLTEIDNDKILLINHQSYMDKFPNIVPEI